MFFVRIFPLFLVLLLVATTADAARWRPGRSLTRPSSVGLRVTLAPPATRAVVTVRPRSPGRGYAWRSGEWVWRDSRWVWRKAGWVLPPRVNVVWRPGRWRSGVWIAGRWR